VDVSALIPDDESHDAVHSEITARYVYDCQQSDKLDAITVYLISHFPEIEELEALWLTEHKQGAIELSKKSNLIKIR